MSTVAPTPLSELDINEEFVKAFEALDSSRQHVFITGKAGTGKSTLLQYFRLKTQKSIAVLAPTGVSAINIKGQTIHSFFQFKPDITPESVPDLIIRKAKRQMYKTLDAVVIDEISMVRADLLDCVDLFLRTHGPDFNKPFGGVQMIFFGDLFQLPPVVRSEEEGLFNGSYYPSPYFFSAKSMTQISLNIFHLKKIYRQTDEGFIRLLNAVRDNELEEHHVTQFNQRLNVGNFQSKEFYIALTTTNAIADRINTQQLSALPGAVKIFKGSTHGDFDKKSLPTQEQLILKVGSQVMMLTNDAEKRWVNGSLGKIVNIVQDKDGTDVIMVQLQAGSVVDVRPHSWELYQYYFNEASQALASKVMGNFTQYPIKLAWAVTIHKAQGQTFDRVIIDIGSGTFAHGQMYVALSRCTNFEGLVLKQPLHPRHILMDQRVLDFVRARAL